MNQDDVRIGDQILGTDDPVKSDHNKGRRDVKGQWDGHEGNVGQTFGVEEMLQFGQSPVWTLALVGWKILKIS